jgi:hypothetical protein
VHVRVCDWVPRSQLPQDWLRDCDAPVAQPPPPAHVLQDVHAFQVHAVVQVRCRV